MPHQKAAWHQKWFKKAEEDKITRQTNNWTIVFDMETKEKPIYKMAQTIWSFDKGSVFSASKWLSQPQDLPTLEMASRTTDYQYKSGNILSQHV